MTEHGGDEEDPYGGDWEEIGGWPDPALPPEEPEAPPQTWPAAEPDPEQPAWPAEQPPPDGDGHDAAGEGQDAG
jgi:hypothetical protein